MPVFKAYHLLSSYRDINKRKVMIYMTYITEEDENILDNNKELNIVRDDLKFKINLNNTYCYGEVDFTNDSDDMYNIENFNFLDYLTGFSGIPIRNGYDYDNHECTSVEQRCGWTETWNPAVLAQFAHGCLGKPDRIVLFRQVL